MDFSSVVAFPDSRHRLYTETDKRKVRRYCDPDQRFIRLVECFREQPLDVQIRVPLPTVMRAAQGAGIGALIGAAGGAVFGYTGGALFSYVLSVLGMTQPGQDEAPSASARTGALGGAVIGSTSGFALGLVWGARETVITFRRSTYYTDWKAGKNQEIMEIFERVINEEKGFQEFICPILQDFPAVPVRCPKGCLYHWPAVQEWIEKNPNSQICTHGLTRAYTFGDFTYDKRYIDRLQSFTLTISESFHEQGAQDLIGQMVETIKADVIANVTCMKNAMLGKAFYALVVELDLSPQMVTNLSQQIDEMYGLTPTYGQHKPLFIGH